MIRSVAFYRISLVIVLIGCGVMTLLLFMHSASNPAFTTIFHFNKQAVRLEEALRLLYLMGLVYVGIYAATRPYLLAPFIGLAILLEMNDIAIEYGFVLAGAVAMLMSTGRMLAQSYLQPDQVLYRRLSWHGLIGVLPLTAVATLNPQIAALATGHSLYYPWMVKFFAWFSALGQVALVVSCHARRLPESSIKQLQPSSGNPQTPLAQKPAGPQFPATVPRYNFANVAGMEEFKARLLQAAQEIVNSRQQSERKSPRNGILLFGDPGNGKTFFAEALAGELKIRFLASSFGDIASKWVGETTERAMAVFDSAIQQAPCLLLLDEVDSILLSRENAADGSQEAPKTTNAILTRLVDIRDKGVVIVAATNLRDKLDAAAIREGRFDFKLEVPPPDLPARVALLRRELTGISVTPNSIERATGRWEGFSVARIQAIGKEVVKSIQSKGETISFESIKSAQRRIQGSLGQRLSEDTPTLDKLVFNEDMGKALAGLAVRMRDIERIEEMGGTIPTGLLFYGPPGTGKTVTARALAKTAEWAFLSYAGHDLIVDPRKIDEMMVRAADLRPCVVMLDEADDILADRRYSGYSGATNKLLGAMDGTAGKIPDVLFVASTNHPDKIDDAMLRGGRFTEKYSFEAPGAPALLRFMESWRAQSKAQFSPDVDWEKLAEEWQGLSLATAKEALQASVNVMITRASNNNIVDNDDLADGYRRVTG
ncbi:MAG: AAA family ATPase [Pseudomonadota bacterium]